MSHRYKTFLCLVTVMLLGVFFQAPEAAAQTGGQVPGQTLGINSDADLWRYIRQAVPVMQPSRMSCQKS